MQENDQNDILVDGIVWVINTILEALADDVFDVKTNVWRNQCHSPSMGVLCTLFICSIGGNFSVSSSGAYASRILDFMHNITRPQLTADQSDLHKCTQSHCLCLSQRLPGSLYKLSMLRCHLRVAGMAHVHVFPPHSNGHDQ